MALRAAHPDSGFRIRDPHSEDMHRHAWQQPKSDEQGCYGTWGCAIAEEKEDETEDAASSDRPGSKRELLLFVRPLVQVTNVILDIRNELASSSLPAIVAHISSSRRPFC